MKTPLLSIAFTVVFMASAGSTAHGQSGIPNTSYHGNSSSNPGVPSEIHFTVANPETLSLLHEEMQIMSRVLKKTLQRELGQDSLNYKMGIPILLKPSTQLIQSTYLDGFGVIFGLNVNFPLLEGSAKSEHQEDTEKAVSSWDEAKRELFAETDPQRGSLKTRGSVPRVRFEGRKVDGLTVQLLQSLKEAAQMKALKAVDFVAVVVTGPDADTFPSVETGSYRSGAFGSSSFGENYGFGGGGGFAGGGFGGMESAFEKQSRNSDSKNRNKPSRLQEYYGFMSVSEGKGNESVLALRVKKSDVDDFGNGEISLDEFREKVAINIYKRPTS